MTQLASEVTAAVEEALQAARAVHHEKLDLAPTTTTTTASATSETSTSIPMSGGDSSVSTAGEGAPASHDFDLASGVPITCSTECLRSDNGSTRATAVASASVTRVVSSMCALHEGSVHIAASCLQPKDMLACVLPSTATPATSAVPLSTALMEYTVVPGSSIMDIALCPKVPSLATTTPEASTKLASNLIMALPANKSAVCVDHVPDAAATVLTQATLDITDSSSSDAFMSMSALLDKPAGADTVVKHEDEQLLVCLRLEQSLVWAAAKDVANADSFSTGASVMPLTLAVLGVNDNSITNKHKAIASRAAPPIKLQHGDRTLGMYLHPKFRLPMLVHAPWDPGEQAKETINPALIRDSLLLVSWLRLPPDRVQFSGGCPYLHFVPGDSKSCHEFLALIERLYELSELNCCCEHRTPWQMQFFISSSRIASSVYAMLICLKARAELEMRLELSMRTDKIPSNCCSIELHHMGTCSPLKITECPWLLASSIQLGTSLFLGTDNFLFQLSIEGYIELQNLLIDSIKLQPWPVWKACFFGHELQYYTEFGSATGANQKKYSTDDCTGRMAVPCFQFGNIGNVSIYGSQQFQWYIAWSVWSLTLARSVVCTIHLARPVINLMAIEAFASDHGLHFLIGGAATHYSDIFQWVIDWAFTMECFVGSFQFRKSFSLADVRELLDIIYVGINTVQIPWDPGACSSSDQRQGNPEGLNDACSSTPNAPSQMPWDPGGLSQDRLGGKPNFKKGGLSAILLVRQGLGWNLGRHCWTSACSEATRDSCYIYNTRWPQIDGLDGSEGFGRTSWLGLAATTLLPPLVPLFLLF